MRSVPLRLYGLSLLSAALQLLPFPLHGPVPEWRRLFCWFCLVPLLYVLTATDKAGRPLRISVVVSLSYLSGVAWFAGNCYWIYQTMFLYGGLPAPVSAGILILFSLYLGLYLALLGLCFSLISLWKGRTAAVLTFPFLWVATELARARITGFPWDLLGYTQVDNLVLTRLAPWTGVIGLSLLIAAVNVLWFWRPLLLGKKRRWAGPVAAVLIAALSYALLLRNVPPSPESAIATLLQDNLNVGQQASQSGQAPESPPAMLANFTLQTLHPAMSPAAADLAARSASAHILQPATDLVLWPEAPTDFMSADPAFRQAMANVARDTHAPVIADAVGLGDRPNPDGRYSEFVSASFFLPNGTYAGRYDKMHLVPFGEYTPYKQLFFFAGHLLDQLNFVPGARRNLFSADGHRYGVFICYESIFGDEIRQFALHGASTLR